MAKEIRLHANLTPRQKEVLRSKSYHHILTGPAGTAKTYTALARGLKLLWDKRVERIVIIRSAVATRSIGFLPGDEADKLDVFTAPYVAILNDLSPKFGYKALESSKHVEFHSTSFLRGMTFERSCIVLDEYQNLSGHELETAVTRVGEHTHLILCGDSDQTDLTNAESREHKRIIRVLTSMEDFHVHEFTTDDIVRSDFVKRYFQTKSRLEGSSPHE